MSNIILLVACFALGIVLRLSGRLPDNTPSALNGFVVNLSLPALTLLTVHSLDPDPKLVLSALWLGCCSASASLSFGSLAAC